MASGLEAILSQPGRQELPGCSGFDSMQHASADKYFENARHSALKGTGTEVAFIKLVLQP
jgi:hypothetical protein